MSERSISSRRRGHQDSTRTLGPSGICRPEWHEWQHGQHSERRQCIHCGGLADSECRGPCDNPEHSARPGYAEHAAPELRASS